MNDLKRKLQREINTCQKCLNKNKMNELQRANEQGRLDGLQTIYQWLTGERFQQEME